MLSKDEDFDFLFVEIDFSGYHNIYVRLWPEDHVARYFPFQNSDDSGVDCCPWQGKKIKVIVSTCSREPIRCCGIDFIERRHTMKPLS